MERLAAQVQPLLHPVESDGWEQGETEDLTPLREQLEAREREAEAIQQTLRKEAKRLEGLWKAEIQGQLTTMQTELRAVTPSLPHIDLTSVSQQAQLLREEQLKEAETQGWIRTELLSLLDTGLHSVLREAAIRSQLATAEIDSELKSLTREMEEISTALQPRDIAALTETYIVSSLQAVEEVKRTADPALRGVLRTKALQETQKQAFELQRALEGSVLARQTADCQRTLESQLDDYLSS